MSERERTETLHRYAIFDSDLEPIFDQLTELVAESFGMPIAAINLLGERTLRLKARYGIDIGELPRAGSFCNETMARGDVFVVRDLALEPKLAALLSPEAANYAFYAGAPLLAPGGAFLGTLCVLDTRPRTLTREQIEQLERFAALTVALFEARRDARTTAAERDQLAAVIDSVPNPVISIVKNGSVTGWNAAATRVFGWTFDEVRSGDLPFVPRDRLAESAQLRSTVMESGQSLTDYETVRVRRDGTQINVSISASPIVDLFGQRIGVSAVLEDISERDRTRERHRRRAKILELTASDASLDHILKQLADDIESVMPRAMATVLARHADQRFCAYHGTRTPATLAARFDRARSSAIRNVDYTKPSTRFIIDLHRSDPFYEAELVSHRFGNRATWLFPVHSAVGTHLGALVIHTPYQREPTADETQMLDECASLAAIAIDRYDARMRLERLALHDALTGLPNRLKFEERLDAAIERAKRNGTRFALGMLDLDRFKFVNDSLGHSIGDKVIVEVADRLRAAMRAEDTVARISGDEFLLILGDIEDRDGVEAAARRVTQTLDASFRPAGEELYLHASFGLAIYPDDATEATQLVRLADSVMYDVKHRGTGIGFFDKTIDDGSIPQFELEMALNRAIRSGEFTLEYQPIVALDGDTVVAAEALLRWHHPQHGRLAPDRFIRTAEETGLIVPIGAWVLGEAARFASRWRAAGGPGNVAVNVSARQFEDRHFVRTVVDAIASSNIAPSQISLEITESLIMSSPESAAAKLHELRRLGVESSIDDFGTGYSSMSYLKRLPVNTLKIDRSFLSDLASASAAESDRAIVESIVALAKALSLRIVAEGVETPEQLAILRTLACDYVQGYLFARPMPADAFLAWRMIAPDAKARIGISA